MKDVITRLIHEAIQQKLREADGAPSKKSSGTKKSASESPPTPPDTEKDAADMAHELDLEYDGWSNWVDSTGKTVARTIDGKLVKVTSDNEPQVGQDSASPPTPTSAPTEPHVGNNKPRNLAHAAQIAAEKAAKYGNPTPPTINGKPMQVSVNGKSGMLDMFDKDKGIAHVTFDDGSGSEVPLKSVKVKMPKQTAAFDDADLNIPPPILKEVERIFKEAGYKPYEPQGLNHRSPRWNKGMDSHDIPYDANAEQTVMKLLELIGDPVLLVKWLVKKFQDPAATTNTKSRIMQYLGVVKKMGLLRSAAKEIPNMPSL